MNIDQSPRFTFLPQMKELAANRYWPQLRIALEQLGATYLDCADFNLSRASLLKYHRRLDVIHIHFVQPFYAFEWTYARLRWVIRLARNMLFARALGYRIVFTLHDLVPTVPLHPTWVDYLGHLAVVSLSDHVIVHCQFARRQLRRFYGRIIGVTIMPHPNFIGIYPSQISRADARAKLGFGSGERVFCFFGGIRPNKGVEPLISAFKRLRNEDNRLVVVGKGWPRSNYVEKVQNLAAADARIQIVPRYIPDDEVQIWLTAADVVVLPFERILTSSSVMLAMSFARPVIVPAMGCLPELISPDEGIVYDSCQRDGLFNALETCANVDLTTMGQRALEKVRPFSWSRMASQSLGVYRGSSSHA